MEKRTSSPGRTLTREALILLSFLLFGLLLLPVLIFAVGQFIFGEFAGGGLGTFFASVHSKLRSGDLLVVFLVLSPYLVVQTLRGTIRLFRNAPSGQP